MKYIDSGRLKYEIERRNLSNYYTTTESYEEKLYEIIDSLEQEMWKPSDEQMKALYCALNDAISQYSNKLSPLYEEVSRTHFEALESLYNDLKKL